MIAPQHRFSVHRNRAPLALTTTDDLDEAIEFVDDLDMRGLALVEVHDHKTGRVIYSRNGNTPPLLPTDFTGL